MRQDAAQIVAILCLTLLAGADLVLLREGSLAVAVVSGLLGWMSHKAVSPTPNP